MPRDAPEDRRHWHTSCWRRVESRRAENAARSERGFDHVDGRAGCRAPRAPTRRRSATCARAPRDARRASAWPACAIDAAWSRVTASAGEPNAVLRRVFTSQNTSTRSRATTRSSSPSRQRQLRSSTSYPAPAYQRRRPASSPRGAERRDRAVGGPPRSGVPGEFLDVDVLERHDADVGDEARRAGTCPRPTRRAARARSRSGRARCGRRASPGW